MAQFWQRTKKRLTAPAQYIQVTDSVSRPMAVMLSLVMLFVALAVLVGLLFIGKWGYEQIAGKTNKPAAPVTGISTGINTDTSGNTTNAGGTATVTSNGTGSAAVTSTPGSSASVSTSGAATTVPNTGAGGTLALFIGSSVIGSILYRLMVVRRLQ